VGPGRRLATLVAGLTDGHLSFFLFCHLFSPNSPVCLSSQASYAEYPITETFITSAERFHVPVLAFNPDIAKKPGMCRGFGRLPR
jgi:hypothetical protein